MIPLLPLIACIDRTETDTDPDSARTDSARTDSVKTYAVADKDFLFSVCFSHRRGEVPYIEVVPDANPSTTWAAVRDRIQPAATLAEVSDAISMNWLALRVPEVHKTHMRSFFASLKLGMGSAAYEVFCSLLAAGALRIMFADDCPWDATSKYQLGAIMTRLDLLDSMRIYPGGRGGFMIMPLKTILRHAWTNCRRGSKRERADGDDSLRVTRSRVSAQARDELAELKDQFAELRAHAARLEEGLLVAELKAAVADEMRV